MEDKTITAIANATAEVAKSSGKGIDAGREFGGFISRYVAGTLEQGMGIFEDKLKYMRWERQLRLMHRAEDLMKEIGLPGPTRAIPLKFAVPLLQAASMEDDDNLQDRWVNLLVNAADKDSGVDLQRAYIDILERLGPVEAKILDAIYCLPYVDMLERGVATARLPESAALSDESSARDGNPSADVHLALANLGRLGCIKPGYTWGGADIYGRINPTILGLKFVEACRVKRDRDSDMI